MSQLYTKYCWYSNGSVVCSKLVNQPSRVISLITVHTVDIVFSEVPFDSVFQS